MKKSFQVKKLATKPARPPFHPEIHLFEILLPRGDNLFGCKIQGQTEPTEEVANQLLTQHPTMFWIEVEAEVITEIEVVEQKPLTSDEENDKLSIVEGQKGDAAESKNISEKS